MKRAALILAALLAAATLHAQEEISFRKFSLSVGTGTSRTGYYVSPRTDIFFSFRLERSIYDPLAIHREGYLGYTLSGNAFLSVGARFRLSH